MPPNEQDHGEHQTGCGEAGGGEGDLLAAAGQKGGEAGRR